MFIFDINNASFITMNYHAQETRNGLKWSNKNGEIEKGASLICCKTKKKYENNEASKSCHVIIIWYGCIVVVSTVYIVILPWHKNMLRLQKEMRSTSLYCSRIREEGGEKEAARERKGGSKEEERTFPSPPYPFPSHHITPHRTAPLHFTSVLLISLPFTLLLFTLILFIDQSIKPSDSV